MRFIEVLKQEYTDIIQSIEQYQAQLKQCDDNCRMGGMSAILERITTLQSIIINVLYSRLKAFSNLSPLLQNAQEKSKALEGHLDNIIFIHVDEPGHQHEENVDELKKFLDNTRQIDFMLLDACPTFLPQQELNELDQSILSRLKQQAVGSY